MGGDPCWSRGSVRSPSPEKEGETETMCGKLTTIPILHPPEVLDRRRLRNQEAKLNPK